MASETFIAFIIYVCVYIFDVLFSLIFNKLLSLLNSRNLWCVFIVKFYVHICNKLNWIKTLCRGWSRSPQFCVLEINVSSELNYLNCYYEKQRFNSDSNWKWIYIFALNLFYCHRNVLSYTVLSTLYILCIYMNLLRLCESLVMNFAEHQIPLFDGNAWSGKAQPT